MAEPPPAAQARPAPRAVPAEIPVLVAEDHPAMQRLITAHLQKLGFSSVDVAPDGARALDMLATGRYRLVLSDWNMAPMSGLDLLKAVRADATLATIPFLLITAETRPDNVLAAKAAGVNGFIAKPFDAAQLRQKLKAVLGPFLTDN